MSQSTSMPPPVTQNPTLFAEDSPVRTFPWLASARAWLESGQASGLPFATLLQHLNRAGSLSKMSPVCYPLTKDGTLPSSFTGWGNSIIGSAAGCLTLNTSEFPKDAVVCSLSEVLETDVPSKYYLSRKACAGILRRAERRGKELPKALRVALAQVADQDQPERVADRTMLSQSPEPSEEVPKAEASEPPTSTTAEPSSQTPVKRSRQKARMGCRTPKVAMR
jgi:hypothetical protein